MMENPYQTPRTDPTLPKNKVYQVEQGMMQFHQFKYPFQYFLNYSQIYPILEVTDADGYYVISSKAEFAGYDKINIYNDPTYKDIAAYIETGVRSRDNPRGLYSPDKIRLAELRSSAFPIFKKHYKLRTTNNKTAQPLAIFIEENPIQNVINKQIGNVWGLRSIISKTFQTELKILLHSETTPCFILKQKPASKGRLYSLEKNSEVTVEEEYLLHMALTHLLLVNRIRG